MLDKSVSSVEYNGQLIQDSISVNKAPHGSESGYTSSGSGSSNSRSDADLPRRLRRQTTYPALEGGWAWAVVLSGFVTHVLTRGCLFSTGILFSEWTSFFGRSKSDTAWIGSIATGCALMLGPLASRLIEKWGYRSTAMFGGAISSVGFVASYWANGVYFLYLTYGLLAGTGMGITYLCGVVAVGEYFDKRRSIAFGISASGAGCGAAVMAVLQRLLLREYGWRGTMIILAGVSGLNQIAFGALLRPLSSSLNWSSKMSRTRLLTHGRDPGLVSNSMTQSSDVSQRAESKQEDDGDGDFKIIHCPVEDDFCTSEQYQEDDDTTNSKYLRPTLAPRERTLSDSGTVCKAAMSPSMLLRRKLKTAYASNPASPALCAKPRMTKSQVHLVDSWEGMSDNANGIGRGEHAHQPRVKPAKSGESLKISVGDAMYLSSLSIPTSHAVLDTILSKNDLASSNSSSLEKKTADFTDECDALINVGSTERRFPPLLRNPLFLILAVNQFFTGLAVMVPFVHLTEKAILMGISESDAAYLVAFIGVGNVIGKIVLGLLCDLKFTDIFVVFLATQIGMTISVSMFPVISNYPALVFASFSFGFFYGNYSAIPSLTAEYVGLRNLAQAIGYITFLEGAAGIMGPPLAGAIYDASLDYNVAFAVAASFLFLSAFILFLQPFLYRRVTGKTSSIMKMCDFLKAEPRQQDDGWMEDERRVKIGRGYAKDCNANYVKRTEK